MKSLLTKSLLALLISLNTFSQVKNHDLVQSGDLSNTQIEKIYESNMFGTEEFKITHSKAIINKILLGNGYLVIEDILQIWEISSWVNNSKRSHTYDGDNNESIILSQYWFNSSWHYYEKSSYAYDGNNNQIEWLDQNWDGSKWVNISKALYTYDNNNNKVEYLRQYWNGSSWYDSSKTIYIYRADNKLINERHQICVNSIWRDSSEYTYIYDIYNNLTEKFSYGTRDLYTYYTNNTLKEEIHQYWTYQLFWQNLKKPHTPMALTTN